MTDDQATPIAPVRLAGRTLRNTRHICAFFHSREEQNKVLMPFFKEGIDRGETCFHIIDSRLHSRHLDDCREFGIDVGAAEGNGQLEVRHWEDAYLKDGRFDGDRMIRYLSGVLERNRGRFKLTRLMGNMEWALESLPGVTDIVEYETKLNYVLPNYPDPIVCVYDVNRHSGGVVMDILRTHPMVIINGVLQENPLYVPPDDFLREVHSRRAERGAGADAGVGSCA
jgi:hypothetical protein